MLYSTELITDFGAKNVPVGLQKQQNSSSIFRSELRFNVPIINHLSLVSGSWMEYAEYMAR